LSSFWSCVLSLVKTIKVAMMFVPRVDFRSFKIGLHDRYPILHRANVRLITLVKSRFDGTHGSPERTWIAPVRVELEHLVI